MHDLAREILVIFLLVVVNGIFAMSEIAVISARKIRLEQLSTKGNYQAKLALKLANNPNQMLSTVQIGITLIGILAGAFGGANLAASLSATLTSLPLLANYAETIALVTVVLSITFLSLVIGELVPKRLALNDPEMIAIRVAFPLRWLASITAPVVYLLGCTTDLILQILGVRTTIKEPLVTEEEIKVMLKQGTEAGMFEVVEQDMVEGVFQLGDKPVNKLMTPRPEIVWLNLDDSAETNRQQIISSKHTRFLVCQGSVDRVLGFVQVMDLLSSCFADEPFELTASLRQPLFVPESTRGLKVLELFKQTGTHIALVVDEYGIIQGLVTLNDILGAIVGDIPNIEKQETSQAVQREDGSWLVDGILSTEEFRKLFNLRTLPGEIRGNFHTLGGFIITYLGKIPMATDHFQWQNLRFEVMDMDGNRVDKVLVTPIETRIMEPLLDQTNDVY